jgi:hypothetical protein
VIFLTLLILVPAKLNIHHLISVPKAPISDILVKQSSKTRLLQLIKHTKKGSVTIIKHYHKIFFQKERCYYICNFTLTATSAQIADRG